MGSFTNYLEQKVLEHVFRGVTYTSPATLYLALFTSDPGEAGGGTEVSTSGTGYARKPVVFGPYSNGQISNSSDVDFGSATAAWGTVTHVAVFDAATGGNMLCYGQLQASKVVNSGDSFVVPAGQCVISLD